MKRLGCSIIFVNDNQQVLLFLRDDDPTIPFPNMWDVLGGLPESRERGTSYEARWLNLAGYLLRPGFGDPLDSWRVGRLWRFFSRGPVFADAVENRVQWWVMWRRVAGGLDAAKQEEMYGRLSGRLLRDKGEAVTDQERSEMWSAVAALELLPKRTRTELGNALVGRIEGARAAQRDVFAVARIGAREPLHAPLDGVLPPKVVSKWVRRLLLVRWPKGFRPDYALLHLARFTGDRARDLPEDLREEVAERLARLPGKGQALAESLFKVTPITAGEERRVFGDTLPLGLRLRW